LSDIHITREHRLGFEQAGKLAYHWAERAEHEFGMECVYQEGNDADRIVFAREGVKGELTVSSDKFVLDAKLGLLYSTMKRRIETEIVNKLDELIEKEEAKAAPHKARHAPARAAAKKAGKRAGKKSKNS